MGHVWMNIIDSLRELIVLTIAGTVVYKLDHRELAAWISTSTGCSREEAKAKLVKCKLPEELVATVQESTKNDSNG